MRKGKRGREWGKKENKGRKEREAPKGREQE